MNIKQKVRAVRRWINEQMYRDAVSEHMDGLMCGNDSEVMGLVYRSINRRREKKFKKLLVQLNLDIEDFEIMMRMIVMVEARFTPGGEPPDGYYQSTYLQS